MKNPDFVFPVFVHLGTPILTSILVFKNTGSSTVFHAWMHIERFYSESLNVYNENGKWLAANTNVERLEAKAIGDAIDDAFSRFGYNNLF